MPTIPLPQDPSLEQLRAQAKDLHHAVAAGTAAAIAHAAEHLPGRDLRTRADAQLVVARHYGFRSWTDLKRHLETVARHSWRPRESGPDEAPADVFLRLACLRWHDDDAARRTRAAALLAARPEIAGTDVYTAAACSVAPRMRELLAADPGAAQRAGGPNGWVALFYLACARHDPSVARAAVLDTASALLEAGADPNAGYLWHGLPTPFTVLTCVLGGGEAGDPATPPHPHAIALAQLLLDAGADPNDGQALYNRMFSVADDHLELLFRYGLGGGDGGPWRRRLGATLPSPAEMLRGQLWWAVTHGQHGRVRLLAEQGVDVQAPFAGRGAPWATGAGDATSPTRLAELTGHPDVTVVLQQFGAAAPVLDPADALLAAALRADRQAVAALDAAHPGARAAARTRRPGAVVQAAAEHGAESVELLVGLGFDVDALARADAPIEQPWETALHVAAGAGDVDLVRRLLGWGADPNRHDSRFDATPLGWARHFGHDDAAAVLTPVTAED